MAGINATKQIVPNPGRRVFLRTAAALGLSALLPRCIGQSSAPQPSMRVSGPSLLKTQLLSDGIDLGDYTIKILTNEAAGQIVYKPLSIKIEKNTGKGIEDLQLMLRLSSEFTDFPIHVTGWSITIKGADFALSPAQFEEQQVTGGEIVIDLPSELNKEGKLESAVIDVQLKIITSEAIVGKDYSIPFQAILQGTK